MCFANLLQNFVSNDSTDFAATLLQPALKTFLAQPPPQEVKGSRNSGPVRYEVCHALIGVASSLLSEEKRSIVLPESRTMQELRSAIFLLNQQNCHSQQRLPKSTFRQSRNDSVFHFAPFRWNNSFKASQMPAGMKMQRSNRYTIIALFQLKLRTFATPKKVLRSEILLTRRHMV